MATFRRPDNGITTTTNDPKQILKYANNPMWTRIGGVDVQERAKGWGNSNDLTRIKGVGTALNDKLVDAGYMTIKSVADGNVTKLVNDLDTTKAKAQAIIASAKELIVNG
jgi:hypothetical protein